MKLESTLNVELDAELLLIDNCFVFEEEKKSIEKNRKVYSLIMNKHKRFLILSQGKKSTVNGVNIFCMMTKTLSTYTTKKRFEYC